MLAILNFPKKNEKWIKILKCLHKILVFVKLMAKTTLLQQSETMYSFVVIFTQKILLRCYNFYSTLVNAYLLLLL